MDVSSDAPHSRLPAVAKSWPESTVGSGFVAGFVLALCLLHMMEASRPGERLSRASDPALWLRVLLALADLVCAAPGRAFCSCGFSVPVSGMRRISVGAKARHTPDRALAAPSHRQRRESVLLASIVEHACAAPIKKMAVRRGSAYTVLQHHLLRRQTTWNY